MTSRPTGDLIDTEDSSGSVLGVPVDMRSRARENAMCTEEVFITADPYRRIAGFYSRVIDPLNRSIWEVALSLCPPQDGQRVLDIGCGTGSALVAYRQAGYLPSGIDGSEAMLDKARERLGPSADLLIGDATALPHEDDTFDLVAAAFVVHEMPSEPRAKVLSEMARVAASDGEILLIEQHAGPPRGIAGRLRRSATVVAERAAGREHYRNYREFVRTGGIPTAAAQAGLTIDRQKIIAKGNVGLFAAMPDGN